MTKYIIYDPILFQELCDDTLEGAQNKARKVIADGHMDRVLILSVDKIHGVMEKVSPIWLPSDKG